MKKPVVILLILASLLLIVSGVMAFDVPSFDFTTPLFGLAVAPDGSLLVADNGAGIIELRKGEGSLVAELPGVTDVAPIGRGSMFAITTFGPTEATPSLYRVSRGTVKEVADILAFEAAVNPDGGEIDSNPFDVEVLPSGDQALIADAGGNSLLIADQDGNVDWVAIFPSELVPTANIKNLLGCPEAPPEFGFVCYFPEMFPAEAVPTSVAIGPDGAYYVGELKGFPAPTGESRVWRIEPGTLNADCATSTACTVVADGFTSIVDLAFGPDGSLYVVELDEASWAAVEFVGATSGTVNSCDSSTWTCCEVAGGLPIPMSVAVDREGTVYAAILALVPGAAEVIMLP